MKNLTECGVAHEAIERLAYNLWEQRGRPDGSDVECWLEAERQLAAPSEPNAKFRTRSESSSDTSETKKGAGKSAAKANAEAVVPVVPYVHQLKPAGTGGRSDRARR